MRAIRLKCNGKYHPCYVSKTGIWFQWNMTCEKNGDCQSAYQLRVKKEGQPIWDSGRIESEECTYQSYQGPELESAAKYCWEVKLWDKEGKEGPWSEESCFITGLEPSDWESQWIGYDKVIGKAFQPDAPFYCADDFLEGENQYYLPPAPYLRKELSLGGEIKEAILYLSAFGIADCYLNGRRANEEYFSTGLSDYPKTVYYRAYPVKDFLKKGTNAVAVVLADGWYAGYTGLTNREWYGHLPRVRLQLVVEYGNGIRERFVSDGSWRASYGKIREADLLQGEAWDQRKEPKGWKQAGFDDSAWDPVDCGAEYPLVPEAYPGLPVEEHGRQSPQWMRKTGAGSMLVSFKNYVCGILKVAVSGERGSRISIRYAEDLNPDGSLWLSGNRSARCQDTFILSGEGSERFCPRFTYHGFRYAEITVSGTAKIEEIEAVSLGTRLEEPSYFHCSDDTLNLVFDMVRATEKANLLEIPTDCTARDERLGWGMEGDHFLYAMTRFHNLYPVIRKWLRDIFDGQKGDGGLEAIAPPLRMKDVEQYVGDLQSNHGVRMVYALYRFYGDRNTVREYFEPLNRYFDFLERNSDRGIRIATSGDWLGIWEESGHSDFNHGYGECKPSIIGTAHYGIAVLMMQELAEAIGETKAAENYRMRYQKIRKMFRLNFIQRNKSLRQGKQAEYLLTLAAGFFNEDETEAAVNHLKAMMTKDGYPRWFGGTPSTPYLLDTLDRYGERELAIEFLRSRKYPSIGYMAEKGFDTIWERWDAIFKDGSRHPQVMNALSHIGFTTVGSYLIDGVAGIQCLKPGYKKILIHPGISKALTCCEASYQSLYGEISVSWKWEGGIFYISFAIPANTTAMVAMPCNGNTDPIVEYGMPRNPKRKGSRVMMEAESGKYRMHARYDL